ncbi:MAG: hypothetical protein WCY00_02530 [Candidatus Dojkabacteria bacterium]
MDILDIFFPKSCTVCKRKGEYLCEKCKKLFKKNLPECYICRRISPNYCTHASCKKSNSLSHVFVAWKYDSFSSNIMKTYKYKSVYTISQMLTAFLTENLFGTQFEKIIKESLVTNVPISSVRLHDRGFNQTEEFAKEIAEKLNLKYSGDFLGRRIEFGHQSLRDKDERGYNLENEFYIKENIHLGKYKSITIVDDVLTTGATLESIINIIRKAYKVDIEINAICMFRGRPYYSKM